MGAALAGYLIFAVALFGGWELAARLVSAGVNVVPLARLHDLSQTDASPKPRADAAVDQAKRIVALQQDRDGTVIDVLRQAGSLN